MKIPHCMSGGKYLVNFDDLLEYFKNPDRNLEETTESEYGKIRMVK